MTISPRARRTSAVSCLQELGGFRRSPYRLALQGLIVATGVAAAGSVFAQDADTSTEEESVKLEQYTVTGSLIPQTDLETAQPVTVITAEDLQLRGFTSVADALQSSSFANGGIQGSQSSASFTQGAETLALFGLKGNYTKFLINGRPMANFPALYNGSDTFNNLSGIPISVVERIEILPGGQSSLYGSDAIAGVINIILKDKLDGVSLSAKAGGYEDGGGDNFRFSAGYGFDAMDGKLNGLVGVQYEYRKPIWAYDRELTAHYYEEGYTSPLASRDYLLYSPFTSYRFLAAADGCSRVTGQFGGTEQMQTRPGFGDENYCGSFYTPGYRTLLNGKESTQAYGKLSYDLNDKTELYGDVLFSHEAVDYHIGSNYTWWGTSVEWGYFYDPNEDNFFNLQRAFAPEDMGPGGFNNSMSTDQSEAYSATLGIKGDIGESAWKYDVNIVRTEYTLREKGFSRLADQINGYFQSTVLGPQLGLDPYYGAYPVFSPNYSAFYTTMSQEDFESFTGFTDSNSRTWDTTARAMLTTPALFPLPGGSAGLALVAEGGEEGWKYMPDPRLLDGGIWGTTAVSGGGERDRYAGMAELRLPLLDQVTFTAAGRYDAFKASGKTTDKPTYSARLEIRPIRQVLLRGQIGTAFKAPTLSDLYQGASGYYSFVTDYYQCAQLGFDPGSIDSCPAAYSNRQFFGTQSGSTELDPVVADVYNYGIVLAPLPRLSIAFDYYNWEIKDEVNTQSSNDLALTEYYCLSGQLDENSGSCQAAFSQITRNSVGNITEIYTPKINVSKQKLESVVAEINYAQPMGRFGRLLANASYTETLRHSQVLYPTDPEIDLTAEPYYNTDPAYKFDASLTWQVAKFAGTIYMSQLGKTPNYRSQVYNSYNTDDYDGVGKVGDWVRYNLTLNYKATEQVGLSFLVNNVLDEMPPEDHSYPGSSGAPYNNQNYNAFGRSYYIEAKYDFAL